MEENLGKNAYGHENWIKCHRKSWWFFVAFSKRFPRFKMLSHIKMKHTKRTHPFSSGQFTYASSQWMQNIKKNIIFYIRLAFQMSKYILKPTLGISVFSFFHFVAIPHSRCVLFYRKHHISCSSFRPFLIENPFSRLHFLISHFATFNFSYYNETFANVKLIY